jgi:ABC-type nitrate/sulfonate/bicarbonate transport system substrate-binding protein
VSLRSSRVRSLRAAGLAGALLTTVLAGCGSDATSTESSSTDAGPVGEVDLAAAGCPDTVVLQTDWNPEAEHGGMYQMLGEDPQIDAGAKSVRGPLVDSAGDYTGVDLEVRSGGPAIGFQTVQAQMYTDESITLGYANTDEAARTSADQPVVSVVAPLEINPQIILWDPETYPDVETIADLGEAGAPVLYFEGSSYMAYLTGAGILSEEQINGSYDGTPSAFVAAGGEAAQQAFASSEPHIYAEELPAWNKEVGFQLLDDAGYPIYASALAVRQADLEPLSGCLTELVPVIQQAQVDYVQDPAAVNELVLQLVEEYDTGWTYSADVAEFSVEQQLELGLVGNGDDETLGNFDLDRVQQVIDIVEPIFAEQGTPVADGLTAEDLVTNEFVDPSIGLPAS